MLIDKDAEVDIADSLVRIMAEQDIAAGRIPPERETGLGILQLRRQAQDDGIVAVLGGARVEAARLVLEVVVRLDDVGLVAADDVGAVLAGESLDLVASRVRVRVQDADDVGELVVGEARVLLASAAAVEGGLGGCGR